jgi:HEAT repeat protein
MLKSEDAQARGGAASALGHLFKVEPVLDALVVSLKDPVSEVRQAALWATASMEGTDAGRSELSDRVRAILVAALRDDDLAVKAAAMSLMEERAWPEALEELLFLARAESAEVRRLAFFALEHHDNPKVDAVLIDARNDADAAVRGTAIRAYGKRSRGAATAVVFTALNDSDASVREIAASVLEDSVDRSAIPHLLAALPTTPRARLALWNIAERIHRSGSPADS